jgi:hypothetical protein
LYDLALEVDEVGVDATGVGEACWATASVAKAFRKMREVVSIWGTSTYGRRRTDLPASMGVTTRGVSKTPKIVK